MLTVPYAKVGMVFLGSQRHCLVFQVTKLVDGASAAP